MARQGTVRQRHLKSCPRDADGRLLPHRCRGSWGFHVELSPDGEGRRRQFTKSGFATRSEARAALNTYLKQIGEGVQPSRRTTGDYLDEWLTAKRALRPTTRRSYAAHIRRYWKPAIGGIQLQELTAHDVDRAIAGFLRAGVTPANLARIHATLRSALNTAVRRRLIPHNPARFVELPRHTRPRQGTWDADQLRTFFASASQDRLFAFYVLAAVTGMRRGELAGLRWDDVDLDAGEVYVVQTRTYVGEREAHVGPPKSTRGARPIALDAGTLALLRRLQERQRSERQEWGPAWTDTGLVFTWQDGRPMRPDYFTDHFRRLAAQAGLPRIRLHGLRHSNASLALEAGVPLKVVSERLGHSTTHFTADVYMHVTRTASRAAADAIGNLLRLGAEAEMPTERDDERRQEGRPESNKLGQDDDGRSAREAGMRPSAAGVRDAFPSMNLAPDPDVDGGERP
jgi:integrase